MSDAAGRFRSLLLGVPAAIRRDYLSTMAVHWSTLALQLVLFHLVAQRGDVHGFAFYQIARSSVSTVQPLAMAGLGTGLQRYLPHCGAAAPALARRAFAVEVAIMAMVALAAYALAGPLADLLGLDGRPAVGAITVLLAGSCLCATSVAALRGTGQVGYANATWVAGLAVVPVLAFILAPGIESFLVLQGAGMLGTAGFAIAATERAGGAGEGPASLRRLLRYGLGRTPGDLALPALFAFPTFVVASALPGAADAGYIGFATSTVTLICSVFGMLTPVLLPRLSVQLHRPESNAALHRGLLVLPLVAAGVAAVGGAIPAVFAPLLVRGFLGADFAAAEPVLRLGLLAAVPLAVFYAVRPTLDALQEHPVTTWLLLGSLVVEIPLTYALGLVLSPSFAAALAFGLAAAVLGSVSYLALTRAMAARAV